MVKCRFINCPSDKRVTEFGRVKFYKFPLSDPVRLKKWLELSGNASLDDNFITTKDMRLCSLHFSANQLLPYSRRLEKDAIPDILTQFPPKQNDSEVMKTFTEGGDQEQLFEVSNTSITSVSTCITTMNSQSNLAEKNKFDIEIGFSLNESNPIETLNYRPSKNKELLNDWKASKKSQEDCNPILKSNNFTNGTDEHSRSSSELNKHLDKADGDLQTNLNNLKKIFIIESKKIKHNHTFKENILKKENMSSSVEKRKEMNENYRNNIPINFDHMYGQLPSSKREISEVELKRKYSKLIRKYKFLKEKLSNLEANSAYDLSNNTTKDEKEINTSQLSNVSSLSSSSSSQVHTSKKNIEIFGKFISESLKTLKEEFAEDAILEITKTIQKYSKKTTNY